MKTSEGMHNRTRGSFYFETELDSEYAGLVTILGSLRYNYFIDSHYEVHTENPNPNTMLSGPSHACVHCGRNAANTKHVHHISYVKKNTQDSKTTSKTNT